MCVIVIASARVSIRACVRTWYACVSYVCACVRTTAYVRENNRSRVCPCVRACETLTEWRFYGRVIIIKTIDENSIVAFLIPVDCGLTQCGRSIQKIIFR